MSDTIEITGLRAATYIGVPEEERANPQTVAIDAILQPTQGFAGIKDDIEGTIDYYTVSLRLREVAADRPRKLIETLANDLAAAVLKDTSIAAIEIRVRKFILADTDSVAVRIRRSQDDH